MALNASGEVYITCPYEKSHSILSGRFQTHLVKCKEAHKASRLVDCPFNATHKIPEIELNCHKTYFCADRKKLDTFMYSTDYSAPLFPVENIEVASSENWDDVQCPTYDADERCKTMPVLIHLPGATPSARKGFRESERQRYRNMNTGAAPGSTGKMNSRLPQTKPATLTKTEVKMQDNIAEEGSASATVEDLPASNGDTKDGFQFPRYARGKGRGRGRGRLQ